MPAWRIEAEQRIERIRKADLTVTVVDSAGKPVEDADVTVEMTRHAFGFGSAVNASLLAQQTPAAEKYREMIPRLFNRVTTENDLKWQGWEGEYASWGINRADALKGLRWLRGQRLAIRGHNLVWPSWQWSPRDLKSLANQPEKLRQRVRNHIIEICDATRDMVDEWDVVNEPFAHHDLMDVLGQEEMVEWFKLARAHSAPGCKLYINDYDVLENAHHHAGHLDAYEKTIRFLLDHHAPLDGIGMQCHFNGEHLTSPEEMLKILDRFGKVGPALQVTEFDIDTADEQRQADYTRDFFITLFSHPKVEGIVLWGFWAGAHWRPQAAMYRDDWSIKPNGKVYEDLVLHQWWTRQRGRTDPAGRFTTRGFLGDYQIRVTAGDKSSLGTTSLGKGGQNYRITVR